MNPKRRRTIFLWVGSSLLAAMFLMAGASKLANAEAAEGRDWAEQMEYWGYPAWFRFVLGAGEVLCAMGVLVPLTRFYAASGLVVVMTGAIVTLVVNAEALGGGVPLALGVIAGLIAWATRPTWVIALLAKSRSTRGA